MQVSKWLGHSTFTLTLDVCGDCIPEQGGGSRRVGTHPPNRKPATRANHPALVVGRPSCLSSSAPQVFSRLVCEWAG